MAQSLKSVNVITLFVEDQLRSKEFYEQIFDVVGVDEGHGTVIFQFDNLFLRLLRREEAESEMLGQVPSAMRVRERRCSWRSPSTTQTPCAGSSRSAGSRSFTGRSIALGACVVQRSSTQTATFGSSALTFPSSEAAPCQASFRNAGADDQADALDQFPTAGPGRNSRTS